MTDDRHGLTAHVHAQALDADLGVVTHEWRIEDREDIAHADQDHRDGRALRRLRQAAAAEGYRVLCYDIEGEWQVQVVPQHTSFVDGAAIFMRTEPTIAEAADKCREALG